MKCAITALSSSLGACHLAIFARFCLNALQLKLVTTHNLRLNIAGIGFERIHSSTHTGEKAQIGLKFDKTTTQITEDKERHRACYSESLLLLSFSKYPHFIVL